MPYSENAPAFRFSPFRKAASLIALAALMTGTAPAAQALRAKSRPATVIESPSGTSLLGSYLAGHVARVTRDSDNAALYYRRALTLDPANEDILDEAFQLELASGNYAEAKNLAQRLIKRQPDNSIAHIFLGADAFKHKNFLTADEHFKTAQRTASQDEPTIKLARAWTGVALGRADKAIASLQSAGKSAWATHFEAVQRAFVADVAKSKTQAEEAYKAVYDKKTPNMRIAEAYARHIAVWGNPQEALAMLEEAGAQENSDGQAAAGRTQGRQDAQAHGGGCRTGACRILPRHWAGAGRQ